MEVFQNRKTAIKYKNILNKYNKIKIFSTIQKLYIKMHTTILLIPESKNSPYLTLAICLKKYLYYHITVIKRQLIKTDSVYENIQQSI